MKESEKAVALFELSKLTILVRKLKKSDLVPAEILEGLSARIDKMRAGIDPATLAAFDAAAAFVEETYALVEKDKDDADR
jgi:hypothetical protein